MKAGTWEDEAQIPAVGANRTAAEALLPRAWRRLCCCRERREDFAIIRRTIKNETSVILSAIALQ